MGTREQMASLVSQTFFLKAEHHGGSGKPPKAVQLQVFAIDYTVTAHQFEVAGETAPDIEIAVALYDSDGQLLNASVSKMADGKAGQASGPRDAYHMEQRVAAPLEARFLRMAVRDVRTNVWRDGDFAAAGGRERNRAETLMGLNMDREIKVQIGTAPN
jgi:hypothetical protein